MNFYTLKNFLYIINIKVFIITILSVFTTYVCGSINLVGNMPTSLIGIAVVFPIVFSINSAFQRRDKALEHYGIINANLASIYFAHLNWSKKKPFKENPDINKIIKELFSYIKKDLVTESLNNKHKKKIYNSFLKISNENEKLRNRDVSDGEISRINNWLNNTIVSFEKISSISDYRTPRGLEAYSQIFLNIFPILFAPYFASLNEVISYLGYIVAILYSSVLVMLSNIQHNVENPFDSIGLDDINLDKENRFKNLFWILILAINLIKISRVIVRLKFSWVIFIIILHHFSLQLNYTYLAVFTIFDLFSHIQADKTFNDNVFQNKQIKTYILLS